MSKVLSKFIVVAAIAAGVAGCVSHSTDVPALAGPSGFAQEVRLTAVPDSISQNGSDTSLITITVTNSQGQPAANVPLRLQTMSNNVIADFGTLSSKNVVTSSNGTATVTFTSPPAQAPGTNAGSCQPTPISAVVIGNCIQVTATPTTNNASQAQTATVEIRLVPQGTILPPAKTPKAAFTFIPSGSILAGQQVSFDGSTSCSEVDATGACVAAPTSSIATYAWDFGDGGTANGKFVTHTYGRSNVFPVTLTVTNTTGGSASTTQAVQVGLPTAPTAGFVFSPTQPNVQDTVQFNAATSKAAVGHSIVSYNWDFGDGTTATGITTSHVYTVNGSYNVVLTITDDVGQTANSTSSVPVGTGLPTVLTTITLGPPASGNITVDASGSTAAGGSTIVQYNFDFGDGTVLTNVAPSQPHHYASAGPWTLKVTVIDSKGRKNTLTQSVTAP